MASESEVELRLLGVAPRLRHFLSQPGGGIGVLRAATATVAYTDTTAKNLFFIPANALVIGFFVDVTTAFDDTGTDQLSIGKTGTTNYYKSALDVSSTGQTVTGWSHLGVQSTSADTQVVAIYAGQNSNAANGAARVTALWLPC